VINQYLSVFELMLAFKAWTKKKDGYWQSSTRDERNDHCKSSSFMDPNQFPKPIGQVHAEGAIHCLIEFLHISEIPHLSLKGELMKNQWNLPKLHWIQHYPQNFTNTGGLRHHDCEIGEKGHQWHGKSIAHTAQKRILEFPHQCALRKMDQIKITCACIKTGDILQSKKTTTTIPISPNRCYIPHNATRFSLTFSDLKYDHNNPHKPIQWNTIVTQVTKPNFDLFLETHLSNNFLQQVMKWLMTAYYGYSV
jgi:hypothetical protein